jgi:hypothetical protein
VTVVVVVVVAAVVCLLVGWLDETSPKPTIGAPISASACGIFQRPIASGFDFQ